MVIKKCILPKNRDLVISALGLIDSYDKSGLPDFSVIQYSSLTQMKVVDVVREIKEVAEEYDKFRNIYNKCSSEIQVAFSRLFLVHQVQYIYHNLSALSRILKATYPDLSKEIPEIWPI